MAIGTMNEVQETGEQEAGSQERTRLLLCGGAQGRRP